MMPMIDEAVLVRHEGDLVGEIGIGEVFAWEPDLQHARELLVVTELTDENHTRGIEIDHLRGRVTLFVESGRGVRTRPLNGDGLECWNSEGRFREACVRTKFNRMPTRRDL